MAHPNLDLFNQMFQHFGSGNMDGVKGLMAPDAVWHVEGNSALAGDHKGPDGILALLGKVGQMSNGTLAIEVHDALASDDHLVVIATGKATVNGVEGTYDELLLWHVKDGKLGERWTFLRDQAAFDKLWA